MPASNPPRTALVGFVALLVVAELVARLQGDRLCSDHPGVVYERDAELGWRHVPGLSGRIGTCDGDAVPVMPGETDGEGLLGPARAHAKPPGTVRVLLLGGNVPEGFGVAPDLTMGPLLEQFADERRGARIEVLNGATGGWALDNSLAFFRRYGAARSPDLVVLVLDPVADLNSISPAGLAALGRRVPAKPYFSLADGRLEPSAPFPLAPAPPAPQPPGLLAHSQLYRLLRRIPAHTGAPMSWAAASDDLPHGTLQEERVRSGELARALLETLRDEVAAAGGRLVTVIAALPGATGPDAVGKTERQQLTAIADDLGIPVLDLTDHLAPVARQGYPLHLRDSVRLSGSGHALAAGTLWTFLTTRGLLPPAVVAARAPTGGHAIPSLAALPRVVAETLWASSHGLLGSFIQLGLLAVCVVWLSAPLPAPARDWVLAGLGVVMLWLLGSREAALVGLGLVVACYGAVELLPPLPAAAAVVLLLGALVVGTTSRHPIHPPGEAWSAPVFLAVASNVALLRLIAYAVDRRRGASRLRLREFLAGMLFFPTLAAGPIETPTHFAEHRAAAVAIPLLAPSLWAIGRIVLGWLEFTLAPVFLALDNSDVFATRGEVFGRLRLWVFVAEVAALFTLLLAGWSNVAIGLAQLVGARPPENMRRPWLAPDVAEYWRRWHASLTTWLRDYLYVPLGGAARGAPRNVVVVFLLSAAWYTWAATKTLGYAGYLPRGWRRPILCALLNAAAVVVIHLLRRRRTEDQAPRMLGTVWRVAATAVFVSLAWLPMILPLWNRLPDLGEVYLRLFFLR